MSFELNNSNSSLKICSGHSSCASSAYLRREDELDQLSAHELTESMGPMYFQTKRYFEIVTLHRDIRSSGMTPSRDSIATVDEFWEDIDTEHLDGRNNSESLIEEPTNLMLFMGERVGTFEKNVNYMQEQTERLTTNIGAAISTVFACGASVGGKV